MPLGAKTPASLATKAATHLTTAYSGWQLDVDVKAFTRIVLHFSLTEQTSAGTLTFLLSSSYDGTNYFPLQESNSGVYTDDERTRAVSADDTFAIAVNTDGLRWLRIEAKADAVGTSVQDMLACNLSGGIA